MLLTVWTTTAKSTYTHNGILRSYHMLFTRALTMTGLCLGPSFSQVWSSLVAQQIKNLPALQETLVWILGWEDPWRRDRLLTPVFMGFPGGSDGKESACNVETWVWKIPRRREWLPTPVFWPGELHGQRSLMGYSPRGLKESDRTEQVKHSTDSIYMGMFCICVLSWEHVVCLNWK